MPPSDIPGRERMTPTDPCPLRGHLREEIQLGVKMAVDPVNATLPPLAARVTTIYSHWFSAPCRVCRHPFRSGDRVRLCPQCEVAYHDDPHFGLNCWHVRFGAG
jgi:hypothetical protein